VPGKFYYKYDVILVYQNTIFRITNKNLKIKLKNFVRVKICCIASLEEAMLAIKYGASALGLVSEMPSGPGVIDEDLIAEIVSRIPPPIATFLLTSKQTAEEIINQQLRTKVNTLQFVDRVPYKELQKLRKQLTGVKLVQVIHVADDNSIEEALSVQGYVDALLLDSGNPNLLVKELGGTGRTHNWSISKQIKNGVNIPVFLAGGLKPGNVLEAIKAVQPYGLDVCNGVRTYNKLDEAKLKNFLNVVSGRV
jgi:phosphoribosylanthranilate isomerase